LFSAAAITSAQLSPGVVDVEVEVEEVGALVVSEYAALMGETGDRVTGDRASGGKETKAALPPVPLIWSKLHAIVARDARAETTKRYQYLCKELYVREYTLTRLLRLFVRGPGHVCSRSTCSSHDVSDCTHISTLFIRIEAVTEGTGPSDSVPSSPEVLDT
jgi:hypothetical protein